MIISQMERNVKKKKEQRKLCRALRERRDNDKEKQRAMDRSEGGWGIK